MYRQRCQQMSSGGVGLPSTAHSRALEANDQGEPAGSYR